MSAERTSHDARANPSKDSPARRGRDTRKGAQDDSSTDGNNSVDASQGDPPDHGVPTHSVARFLWETPPETPVDKLGERWERWRDSSEQTDLGRWSE